MIFDRVLSSIIKDKGIKEQGGYVGIPYPFPRLSDVIPVIEKGHSIGVLAGTGIGKSKWTRFVFIYHVYKFCKETGYRAHILYFPLEDNKEKVYKNMICHYLAQEHDIHISVQELTSRTRILPDFVLERLLEANEYFKEFEDFVEFVDDCSKPTEIFEYCKEYARKTGKTHKESKTYVSDVHTIVVIDNMSNVDLEELMRADREAMILLAKEYVREYLCNKLGFTVVQVLQMAFDKEKQQFTHSGMSIISKLEPSLDGIGEAKTISRSMHLIFGLFNPDRYELIQYPIPPRTDPENCYRIDILRDRFRSIKIIKSNDSAVGKRIGLLFNPYSEVFEELPLPKTPELKKVYEDFLRKQGNKPAQEVKLTFNQEFKETVEDTDDPF